MKEMKCSKKIKQKVDSILEKLILNDPLQKTRFEYSLQIKNNQLKNGLRFVNYDTFYLISEEDLYLKRLNLIKDIALSCFGQKPVLLKFFNIIKKFSQYRLPLHLGLEFQNNKEILLKFYLNFFSLYRQNKKLAQYVVQNILYKLNLEARIKEREVALVCLDLNRKTKKFTHVKIYYLYNKKFKIETLDFSQYELSFFHWLNSQNRLDYFDIMERYDNKKLISKKIEVSPRKYNDILIQLGKISGNQRVIPKIQRIIDNTNGEIQVITIEKNKITLYITLLNYGSPKELQ